MPQTKFNCTHCEKCCTEIATQIRLSLHDVQRISDFLEIPVDQLIDKSIALVPFKESDTTYKFELGLILPCKYYNTKLKTDKCNIYKARPINCRMFPYWILVKFHEKGISDPLTDCLSDLKLDEEEVKKYKNYCNKVIEVFDEEFENTENTMKKHNIEKTIDISKYPEYQTIKDATPQSLTEHKYIERMKVRLAIKIFDEDKESQELIKKLKQLFNETDIKEQSTTNMKRLNDFEKELE